MAFIQGFEFRERLFESENSVVVRAVREEDGRPVVIKILKNDYPSLGELARYRREYEITCSLDLPGVIRCHELRRHEKTLLMVFEDFGATSVRHVLQERALSLDEFFDAALQIVTALGELHRAHVIHKDISPQNLVINPSTGETKIIDFGIATRISRERPAPAGPEVVEGTIAYMSPEQTGRTNRSLDYRTDFYSLGATFYEMLTRNRPFDADDEMELVHCHIAREPVPVHRRNPDVPLALSKIVGRLMAKRAEDRYHSVAGLIADLETVRRGDALDRFEPGRHDITDRFQIPERLYGRSAEVERLLEAFERVRQGNAEMMLVSGYSGVGKSALINEIHRPITRARGYFIRGKFDQLQRNVPYSGLVVAFHDLTRQLLTESPARLAAWRQELNDALAPNGQVILDVLPDLGMIIGEQPPVARLEPAEATNRLNRAFIQLLRCLCGGDRVVVLFLDDLQWADLATLNLLRALFADGGIEQLFLIGAYRDNEVTPMHPLTLALDEIKASGGVVTNVSLAPLGLADVARLLADTLHTDTATVNPLARLVLQKTQGNPLFVRQFLLTLHEQGLIRHDAERPGERVRWTWDVPAIRAANITDNVVDLLLGKMRRLAPETQEALRFAACIGSRFEIGTLALISGCRPEETFDYLQPAIEDGFIRPLSELSPLHADDVLSPLLVREFDFQHDRIQQAAYNLTEEDQRRLVHLAIGRRLHATLPPEDVNDRVFELVDHLNIGRQLITDRAERTDLAQLNLVAAHRAADATAYAAAMAYIDAAQSLLADDSWDTDYALTLDIFRLRGELEYLNRNFDRCSEIVATTLAHVRTDLEKAEVYFTRIMQHTLLTQFDEALAAGHSALALVGVDFALDDVRRAGQQAVGKAAALLADRDVSSLIDNPPVDSRGIALAQRCLRHLTITAFLSNQELFPLIVGTSVSLSLEHGNAPESALSFANFGLILGAFMGRYHEGLELGRLALRLCERFPDRAPTATVCLVLGSELVPWVQHVREAIPVVNRGYEEGLASGDILWAGYLVMYRVILDGFSGKHLDTMLDGMDEQLAFTVRTQNPGATAGIQAHQIVFSALSGRTKSSADFAAGDIDEAGFLQFCEERHLSMALCLYKILKAQALYLFGQPQQALAATEEIAGQLSYIVNHPNLADHLLHQSLSLAALWDGPASGAGQAALARMQANLAQLTAWAQSCPDNFLAKQLMVEAEIARITGNDAAAELYDQAIDAAHKGQFVQDEALANELAARFVMERRPRSRVGAMYLRDARYAYQLWGALRKAEELEMEFPQLFTEYRDPRAAVSTVTTGNPVTRRVATGRGGASSLDLNTVIKACQTISGEVVLDQLLDRLLRILIENAGAQRGCLLLIRNGDLYVEADGSVASDDVSVLLSIPLDSTEGAAMVPASVIHLAARSQEVIAIDDAQQDVRFILDPYIQKRETRSILCQPILHQGQLIGLAYLENSLVSGAFTPERTRLLSLLSAQIAVSLRNAELVLNLEEKVRERTAALELRSQFIEQTFGRYMSNEIVESLLRSPGELDFAGRKKTVTVMVSDLRGFTAFSETLPPETIVKLLNYYLSTMTTIIQKYHGTIGDFVGDGIFTVFGTPFQRPDDAERAIACALEMQLAIPQINQWNAEQGFPQLEMGIGIHTGEVVEGNLGSDKRAKYSVVGNNVTIAYRIEAYTTGGQIFISGATRAAVRSPLAILDTMTIEPKGVAQPIRVYQVGGLGGSHKLSLPQREERWTQLAPPIPVSFQWVIGKEVVKEQQAGTLVRISAAEAEILCTTPPPPLTDLKLAVSAGEDVINGIYGKVAHRPASNGTFALRFTAVPTNATAYFNRLAALEQPA